MDGYFKLQKPHKLADILGKGINFLFFSFLFFSCDTRKEKTNNYPSVCYSEYSLSVRKMAIDSVNEWKNNELGLYKYLKHKNWYIDSLIAFNIDTTRLITAYISNNNDDPNANNDAMCFFYGEKINNKWYFFKGAGIVIPRSMVKDHPTDKPLSYQQLHEIALKEVYAGYLVFGEINEKWFISHFEGPGWGDFTKQEKYDDILKGKRYKTRREFFEQMHLEVVRNNWNGYKQDTLIN